MKRLANKTNVSAPDTDYEYGRIKDNAGLNDGTPVDVEVYGDMHQFLERLIDQSGVVANGLPDNKTNGYQLFEALQKLIDPDFTSSGITFASISLNTWANLGSGHYNVGYKVTGNEVKLCGAATIAGLAVGSPTIFTLPSAARPASICEVIAKARIGGSFAAVSLVINTDGTVTIDSSSTSSCNIYLDGLSFRKV